MIPEIVNPDAHQFSSSLAHFYACVHDSATTSCPILIKFGT